MKETIKDSLLECKVFLDRRAHCMHNKVNENRLNQVIRLKNVLFLYTKRKLHTLLKKNKGWGGGHL